MQGIEDEESRLEYKDNEITSCVHSSVSTGSLPLSQVHSDVMRGFSSNNFMIKVFMHF